MSVALSISRPHVPAPINLQAVSNVEVDAWRDGERAFTVFDAPDATGASFPRHFAEEESSPAAPGR